MEFCLGYLALSLVTVAREVWKLPNASKHFGQIVSFNIWLASTKYINNYYWIYISQENNFLYQFEFLSSCDKALIKTTVIVLIVLGHILNKFVYSSKGFLKNPKKKWIENQILVDFLFPVTF